MHQKEENLFLKFVKSLRPFEWAIIVIIFGFVGMFVWSFSQTTPKVAPEQQAPKPETMVRLYEFWGQGCPHCAAAEPFLKALDDEKKELDVHKYEVYYNPVNQEKNNKVAEALGKEAGGVPFIVVGDEVFNGFDDENGVGQEIRDRVDFCIQNSCPDKAGEVLGFPKLKNTSLETASKQVSTKYNNISVTEAKKLIQENQSNQEFAIIDVRTPAEFAENKIDPKAVNIDVDSPDFESEINKLDKSKSYLVYCRTGRRSAIASQKMTDSGFTKIQNMEGGTVEWFNSSQKN